MGFVWTLAWQSALAVAAIILFTRLHGLRSFSKMSGFDFAITVAFGSILASAVTTPGTSIATPLTGLAILFGIQLIMSQTRVRSKLMRQVVDNEALLVMRGREMDEAAMASVGMTKEDLYAKLREANVTDLDQVMAVVMETTGDVSVLHGEGGFEALGPNVLQGVKGR